MSINGSPRFGCVTDINETIAAGSGSAVGSIRAVSLGATAGAANVATPAILTAGTGSPTSINVVCDGLVTLSGAGTLTIDLTTFVAPGGNKTLAKCRGFQVLNTGAADGGATLGVTVAAGASNGFTAGGDLTTAGAVVLPNCQKSATNLSTAGWTVGATTKNVTFTAGSAGATFYFVFWGE